MSVQARHPLAVGDGSPRLFALLLICLFFFVGTKTGRGEESALLKNPDAAGLWQGRVEITAVGDVTSATPEVPREAPSPFAMRILLHVDDSGQVRLLRQVTVMQEKAPRTTADGQEVHDQVLVTDDTLLSRYQGVAERAGRSVGVRFGSLAYDFDPGRNELELAGGIGSGLSVLGRITLAADHPTNPFRHLYHPDHRHGYEVVRLVTISFDSEPTGQADTSLQGNYQEIIAGLHKTTLVLRGRVSLERVSVIASLNGGSQQ